MNKSPWVTSKAYPGVRWREGVRGRVYYITYKRGGKKHWERVGSKDEGVDAKLAAALRRKRLKAVSYHEELPQDRANMPTFGEVAERFLAWADHHKKSVRDDRARYRDHLAPRFAHLKADQIAPLDLERLKRHLRESGRADGTVKQVLSLFRVIFNCGLAKGKRGKVRGGEAWGMIPRTVPNPIDGVEMPTLDNQRERFLSEEEIDLLLSELKARSSVVYGVALLALNTGGRLGEILALSWSNVNLDARTLTFLNTKSGKTRRIPLNEEAYGLLASMERGRPNTPVFTTGSGRKIKNLSKTFQRVADKLFNQDLDPKDRRSKVTFHTLRHSAASHMVMNGVPLATVARILGHASLDMVNRYSHLAPDHERAAVGVLQRRKPGEVIPLRTQAGAEEGES